MHIFLSHKNINPQTLLGIFALFVFLVLLFVLFLTGNILNTPNNSVNHNDQKIFNLSVAFYLFGTLNTAHSLKNIDLERPFWETQITSSFQGISLNYYYESRTQTLNDKWIRFQDDKYSCSKTIYSWKHFCQNETSTKWYFKANLDTYINLTNLYNYIQSLERQFNPLTVPFFSYALIEANDFVYPALSTGWLISSAGIQLLYNNDAFYRYSCEDRGHGDAKALGSLLLSLQQNIEDFENSYFIPEWPSNYLDFFQDISILKNSLESVFPKCPLYVINRFPHINKTKVLLPEKVISTFFQNIDKDLVYDRVKAIPSNLGIMYTQNNQPIFCHLT